MTHRVGTKGQVVIPKEIRDLTGIKPGESVDFESDGTEVTIRRSAGNPELRRRNIRSLRGMWSGLTGGERDLERERKADREREERKAGRRTDDHP